MAQPDSLASRTPLVPARVLVALALALGAVVVLSVVVALLVWHTSALHPVQVPAVAQA